MSSNVGNTSQIPPDCIALGTLPLVVGPSASTPTPTSKTAMLAFLAQNLSTHPDRISSAWSGSRSAVRRGWVVRRRRVAASLSFSRKAATAPLGGRTPLSRSSPRRVPEVVIAWTRRSKCVAYIAGSSVGSLVAGIPGTAALARQARSRDRAWKRRAITGGKCPNNCCCSTPHYYCTVY
jgi:hypothetical protein